MKLNYITFMVRDIKKSEEFYKELANLKEVNRITLPNGQLLFLANEIGETMIELIEFQEIEKVSTKGMVVSFKVEENVELLREKAIKLGYSPSEIVDDGKKPKHFKVSDPDGIMVEFGL